MIFFLSKDHQPFEGLTRQGRHLLIRRMKSRRVGFFFLGAGAITMDKKKDAIIFYICCVMLYAYDFFGVEDDILAVGKCRITCS